MPQTFMGRHLLFHDGGALPTPISIVQTAYGNHISSPTGAHFGSALTIGNVIVAADTTRDSDAAGVSTDGVGSDGSWTSSIQSVMTVTAGFDGMSLQAKTSVAGDDRYWKNESDNEGKNTETFIIELAGATLAGIEALSAAHYTTASPNIGSFTVYKGDIVFMMIAQQNNGDPVVTPGLWTELRDQNMYAGGHPWMWVGYQIIAADGTCTATVTTSVAGNQAVGALHIRPLSRF